MKIDADLVIMSSSGWAHGFRTNGRTLVYCYSPARWLYETERYLGDGASRTTKTALRLLSPMLRRWDRRAAKRADTYLAISTVTQKRIARAYGRDSTIVPAPHHLTADHTRRRPRLSSTPTDYFLVVSRLLPYKNIRPIVEAFAERPELNLVIIGRGPQKAELQEVASANVKFLEGLTEDEMISAYQNCTALIAASHEDFGLTPLEAAMQGKPSATLRWGGFLDTLAEGVTNVYFDEPTSEQIGKAVDELRARDWDPVALRTVAEKFNEEAFASQVLTHVRTLLAVPPS